MDIGKIIKEQRLKMNMTQEELAQKFHVSRQLISKWENGKSYPDLNQIVEISDLFSQSLDELLRGDKIMFKEVSLEKNKKRILYGIICGLSGLFLAIGGWMAYNKWDEGKLLSFDDVEITSIKKVPLPATDTLPADIEYEIHFEVKKPFVKVSGERDGYQTTSDRNTILVLGQGERSLFGGNKKGRIIISSSRREKGVSPEELNNGKKLVWQNWHDNGKNESKNTLADEGTVILTK
ncbi:helix-turn-helix domain-containing protein [Candidatus Enterococcus mansonii]|uniref:HTH cro/C1-type domain-containing protein n=1 Tax=Candidatus Enterococcus mansonii TaxID=1834181 RepID=A0A242C6B0_9ENTE|nr:helix-turn-helix transcriptional regulator [Enterococcus sp. 4G2_DIV0659]OTO05797.1 hypothetical protein A5880_002972 [Enterococcus sp. 4G2_DIV0659]